MQLASGVDLAAEKPPTGEVACMVGWGKACDSFSCDVFPRLERVCAPVIEDSDAEAYHGPKDWQESVCVDTAGARGTCAGDSGGPLFDAAGKLVAVSSFGSVFGCESGAPSCFLSVPHHLDWISDG